MTSSQNFISWYITWNFLILILLSFTHRLIFFWKGLTFSFAMRKQINSRVKLLKGHIGTLNISCKKKIWMTYMLHKIYEWSAFHWCELSNFIIACLLSTNQDGVRKSYFLWKTATSVGVIAHNSRSCKKRAEIWNIDEQGHMV